MKKLGLALLLLPTISFADNVNFVGAEYAWTSGYTGLNVDGYTVSYKAVIDENLSAGLGYVVIDVEDYYGYGYRSDVAIAQVDYAFGSFKTGSLYAGVGIGFSDGNTEEAVEVGFAKRSGEGFDYGLAVTFDDGDSAVEASFRAPLGDSGLGWTFGVGVSDGITASRTGLNIAF